MFPPCWFRQVIRNRKSRKNVVHKHKPDEELKMVFILSLIFVSYFATSLSY